MAVIPFPGATGDGKVPKNESPKDEMRGAVSLEHLHALGVWLRDRFGDDVMAAMGTCVILVAVILGEWERRMNVAQEDVEATWTALMEAAKAAYARVRRGEPPV